MKPPFSYYGGKTTLGPWIVDRLPPHRHYVEPFAGSLSVLLAKPPTAWETVNDLNADLMTFWRVLRDRPNELIRACSMTPHSRAEHRESFDPATDDLEQARRVWVRLSQGRTGRLTPTGWRRRVDVSNGSGSITRSLGVLVERMSDVATRLVSVSLECRPALDVIRDYGTSDDVCLYVDPPYFGERASNYHHEMTDEAAHQELSDALRSCRAAVVLSGYDSPLYRDLYPGWHVSALETHTLQGGHRAARTEVLWCNRAPQGSLFDIGDAA